MKPSESNQYRDLLQKYNIQKLYLEKIEKRLKVFEDQLNRMKKERVEIKDKTRKELIKSNEIVARDILIKQMQFELKKQKDITSLYNVQIQRDQELETIKSTDRFPVIVIENFNKKDIDTAHKEFVLRGQVVYFKNFKYSIPALKVLIDFGPKAILNVDKQHSSMLNKHKIIAKNIEPQIHSFFGSIKISDLE
ncbi:MAG: hypothetical protein KJ906_01805 [Nanoarchaeota archaeon]|nr:hypothetical protein [Nanoarchaeota archaeon]